MPNYDLQKLLKETSAGVLELGGARMALLDVSAGFWGIRRQMGALIGERLTNSVLQQAGANGGVSFARSMQGQFVEKAAAFSACVQAYQAAGFGHFEIVSMEWPLGHIQIQAREGFEAWMFQQHGDKSDAAVCAYSAGVFVGFVNMIGERQDVVCIEHACQAKGDELCSFELLPAAEAKGQVVVPYMPDPGLGRQINLLEMLFERMPMGIAVLDRDYRIQRYNPTWDDFSARYAPPNGIPLAPGVGYFDHLPGSEASILPIFERTLAGETIQQNEVRLESGGIVTYWDVVLSPLVEEDEIAGILAVSTDATERVMLQQNLEQRVDERTRELASLLDISSNLGSTLDLEQLLDLILDQLGNVLAYDAASIMTLKENVLQILAYRGPIKHDEALQIQLPVQNARANRDVILQRKPIIIPDIYAEDDLAIAIRMVAGEALETTFGYLRCWMGVPLIVKDKVVGMLTLDHREPGHYSPSDAELALAFANQAAVAIENAQLYQETERRVEESETLFAVQQAITSKLEMGEILQMIADEARRLTRTDISAVYLMKGDGLEISYVSGDVPREILGYRLSVQDSIAGRVIQTRESILVLDTWEDARVDRTAADRVGARSLLIVPLISGSETTGTITVANHTPGGFSPEDEQLLTKLAANVVISLENARLYQAEQDRREVAESLGDILAALNSGRSPREIFEYIARRSSELLAADASMVYSLKELEITHEGGYNLPERMIKLKPGPMYKGEANQKLLRKQPVFIQDTKPYLDRLLNQPDLTQLQREWYTIIQENFQSYLGIPLTVRGQIFGGMILYFEEQRNLTEEDLQLGLILGEHAALAIENSRLRAEERERRLESERRYQVAESLREIIGMINSNMSIEEFLDKAVAMATERLGAAACILHRIDLEKGEVAHVASYGLEGVYEKGRMRSFHNLKASGAEKYIEATAQRQPTYTNYPPLPERVDEIRRDKTIPEAIKKERITLRECFAGSFSAPLFIQERLFGGMVFYYSEPQEFSTEQIQLGMTFAEQVAVAIENARLHQAEQDRQRELQLLLEVASTANSSLDMDEILAQTLDLLVESVETSRAGVILVDEASGKWLPHTIRPARDIEPSDLAEMIKACQVVMDSGESLYIAPDPESGLMEPGALLPLQIRGRVLGVLAIIGQQGSRFTAGQLALFKSIADQLGVAIENARLFEKAEEAAIAAERNRLARDLHDAVTQTLFSASLIADVLPKIWEKKPEEGHKRLEELRQLTRGALSEMRTLLLELRPAALVDTDLGDLIGHQVNAFSARTRLPVSYVRNCEGNPPPEVKEMFYRVTQEAFNNIAKHADADQIGVKFDSHVEQVELVIRDDGNGFDMEQGMTEGLGIGIMQERARNVGAQLEIYSQIHEGTRLRIFWQKPDDKECKDD